MGVEERIDIAESSIGNELIEKEGDGVVVEPHDGMEFESEDAAKIIFDEKTLQMEFVQNWRRAAEAVADYAGCENLAKTTAKTLRQNITTHFLCNPAFNANYCAQDFPSLQSSQLFPPLFRPQEAQVPPPHFLVPPPPNKYQESLFFAATTIFCFDKNGPS